MGGIGSGRDAEHHHHLVEHSLTLDLPSLIRRGRVRDGHKGEGRLCFTEIDGRHLNVAFLYDLTDPPLGYLALKYVRVFHGGGRREIMQFIRLTSTEPHFGGRRWWMICPHGRQRVAKLYLPPGGDTFASREEWDLIYASQQQCGLDRQFARLDRIERHLGRSL